MTLAFNETSPHYSTRKSPVLVLVANLGSTSFHRLYDMSTEQCLRAVPLIVSVKLKATAW